MNSKIPDGYRGRLAPSPTGFLHLGHAATFWQAQERARERKGKLILRIEDLDQARCRPEFRAAIVEDLHWFGLDWDEGPDVGWKFASYLQSERISLYLEAWRKLRNGGFIYPCSCSRQDVLEAANAPHPENEEPIYPGICRPVEGIISTASAPAGVNWRFRVPEGEPMEFFDQREGRQSAISGRDFGDFVIWRKDDVPAYQLAVVVDDAAMEISEVVRGADLLVSTFRQLLIYRALEIDPPQFYHTALLTDATGQRLAKRHASLSLRALRNSGKTPEQIRNENGLGLGV